MAGAAEFCARNGFEPIDTLTTVEAGIAGMREWLQRLRERLAIPEGGRIVPLRAAPPDQIAKLHAESVARQGGADHWRGMVAGTVGLDPSVVVMVKDRVAGILLGELKDGLAVVSSRAVAAGFQGGWVNATMIGAALDIAWEHGLSARASAIRSRTVIHRSWRRDSERRR